jgi:acyl-coenzyme A thioesterase PaaI-like protein
MADPTHEPALARMSAPSRPAHLNQPGGRFRAAIHSNVAGRERELRAMADAVRRLVRITTNNTGDAAWTADAAQRIAAVAAALEPALPAVPPPRYGALRPPGAPVLEPHDTFPYDVMLGLYNPLALPIEMEWHPPRAIGRATFDTPYEGPPGCVHGAVLAAAFDQVINIANLHSGNAGPTRTLALEYQRPTPLGAPLEFEAWVEAVDGRKVKSRALVRHAGEVTAEAHGLFIRVDRERVMRLSESEG